MEVKGEVEENSERNAHYGLYGDDGEGFKDDLSQCGCDTL